MRRPVLVLALLLTAMEHASAHGVITAAWTVGQEVEGEVGFSTGDLAPAGTLVRVFGPDGELLGETRIDGDGLFRFTPTEAVPHRFVADLGQGHVGEVVLGLDELPPIPPERAASGQPATAATAPPAAVTAGLDEAALEQIVRTAVQRELVPLKRALAEREQRADLQSIIGGLGYIAGLFGLYFFLQARRRRA